MASSLKVIRAATFEPLTLAEAKLHLRETGTLQDSHILSCIRTAREQTEKHLNRSLLNQQLRWSTDRFPNHFARGGMLGPYPNYSFESVLIHGLSWHGRSIHLPRPPTISVDSISYIDENGAPQVWNSSQYVVDTDSEPARIAPAYGISWPCTQARISPIAILFTGGYPSTALSTIAVSIVANVAAQAVTPASMVGITFGRTLMIDEGTANQESVFVTAVTGSTFTAVFQNAHAGPGITVGISTIPETFKSAMKLWVSQLYEFREPTTEKQSNVIQFGIDRLLAMDRDYEIPS